VFGNKLEVTLINFCHDLWCQKTRVLGYLVVLFACVRLSCFDTIPECDRQTDRQTDTRPGHIPC